MYCPKCKSNNLTFNRQQQQIRWLSYKVKNNGQISQKYNSTEGGWDSDNLMESFECKECGWIRFISDFDRNNKDDNVFLEAVNLFYNQMR